MTTIKGQQSGYTAIGNSKGVTLVVPTINMDGEMVQFDFAMDKLVAVQLIEALQDAVKVHDISVKAKSSNARADLPPTPGAARDSGTENAIGG